MASNDTSGAQAAPANQSHAATAATDPPATTGQGAANAAPPAQAPPPPAAHPPAQQSANQDDEGMEPTDLEGWRRYTRRLSRESADRRKSLADVTAERDSLRSELDSVKGQALRTRVAADVGLHPDLADRIRGDSEAAMREDAERLRDLADPIGNAGVRVGAASTSAGSGTQDMNRLLRRAAGRRG